MEFSQPQPLTVSVGGWYLTRRLDVSRVRETQVRFRTRVQPLTSFVTVPCPVLCRYDHHPPTPLLVSSAQVKVPVTTSLIVTDTDRRPRSTPSDPSLQVHPDRRIPVKPTLGLIPGLTELRRTKTRTKGRKGHLDTRWSGGNLV